MHSRVLITISVLSIVLRRGFLVSENYLRRSDWRPVRMIKLIRFENMKIYFNLVRSLIVGMHDFTASGDTLNWRTYRRYGLVYCSKTNEKIGRGRARHRFYTVASLCPRSSIGGSIQRFESRGTENNGFPSGTLAVPSRKSCPWLGISWNNCEGRCKSEILFGTVKYGLINRRISKDYYCRAI